MNSKTTKERLLAIFLAIAVSVTMIPGVFLCSAQHAYAAKTITLNGKKFEYKDAYGDWHTNTYFSGSGYEGLCAKAHYHAITGKHSYTMYDSSKFCKNNIMAKLTYYYGYTKGWTGGTNGAKLARCLNYVSTQSGAKDKGKAFNFKEKTLKEMVNTVKNVKIPEGFECWFVIPTGDTSKQAAVIWKYTPPGKLSLVKSSSVIGYKKSFAGCEYTVYKSDKKTAAGKLTCNADGSTNTLSLQPDTYYVRETNTNGNYLLNNAWYTAKVVSKQTTKIKASDYAEGSVALQKTFTPDSDDGFVLEGFQFTFQSTADSNLKYTAVTDTNGKINIGAMKPGAYSVTENLTAEQQENGYANESKQGQTVTVENGKTTQITWKNSYSKKNQLVIIKTTDDGSPVGGFHFSVQGDIRSRELTQDALLAYAHITPVKVRDGFALGEFHVNEAELAELNNAAKNKETGSCTVHVTAEATGPAQPPQSRELEAFLEGEDSYVFAKGDVLLYEGTLYIAQEARTYSRDQIQGTGGEECLLDDESFFKIYEQEEETVNIAVPVWVTLRSVCDQNDIADPVEPASISEPEGWTIKYNDIIWAGSADTYDKNDAETTTGENGLVRIADLFPGTYTVTEELTKEQGDHFKAPAAQTKTLEEGDNEPPIVFRFENKTKTTDVSLIKTNAGKDGAVAGFEFTLTGTRAFDGAELEPVTAVTEEDGRIDFGELYAGNYVLEETGFDPSSYVFHDEYRLEGHENPAKAFTVTGDEEAPIEIAFENDPVTNLFLTKVDRESQMFLDGAVFDLYEDGEKAVTFSIVRGEDGKAEADILWKAEGSRIEAGNEDVESFGSEDPEDTADDENGTEGSESESGEIAAENPGDNGAVEYNYAVLRGLKRHGAYRLVETKAPNGYAASVDYPFTFEEDMEPLVLDNASPEIHTEARDAAAGLHMSNAEGGIVTLIDAVRYKGLTPGKDYTMTGRLVFKPQTQEETDASSEDVNAVVAGGRAIEKTVSFTPEEGEGSVEVKFSFDASELEGAKTVIFESLGDPKLPIGDSIIATHSETDNEEQSIYFPALRTAARGEDTGMRITNADDETVIIDTVEYANVIAGRVYEIHGMLMDQETGRPVTVDGEEGSEKVTASVRFKATANGPVYEDDPAFAEEEPAAEGGENEVELVSGTVDLTFRLDARKYAGKSLVAFEELYSDSKLIGQHKDIKDKGQTVRVPAIETKASSGKSKIRDKVKYKNLIPGKTYIMYGVLMDKATKKAVILDGRKLTSEMEFTPVKSHGNVTLSFKADTSKLKGRTLVAFETCYIRIDSDEGEKTVEIAAHRRFDAKSQTLSFASPRTGENLPRNLPAAFAVMLMSAAYLIRRLFLRR